MPINADSLATLSASTSGNTNDADLPPNSRMVGRWRNDAAWETARPAAAPPVKEISPMSGWAHSRAPTSGPPAATFTRPAGNPAAVTNDAKYRLENGAHSEGLTTTAFPAARAGATLSERATTGPFHGMIAATTP
jgi:hypothetical protein